MEIPDVPQPPDFYQRHLMRRYFWQEMGLHYEETPHGLVEETMVALALEKKHPQRFQKKEAAGGS